GPPPPRTAAPPPARLAPPGPRPLAGTRRRAAGRVATRCVASPRCLSLLSAIYPSISEGLASEPGRIHFIALHWLPLQRNRPPGKATKPLRHCPPLRADPPAGAPGIGAGGAAAPLMPEALPGLGGFRNSSKNSLRVESSSTSCERASIS